MPDPIRATFAAALALAAPLASAQADAGTAWLCHLDESAVRLVCVVEAHGAPPPSAPTATVNGTRFPLDPARLWVVDLWTPPSEMDFVEQLARATICYRSPGCSVQVAPPRASTSGAMLRTASR